MPLAESLCYRAPMAHPYRFARALSLLVATTPAASWAAPPATPAPHAREGASGTTPAADVVALHDGSLFRGVVVELLVGDHVTLDTVTGERKTFPMARVAYAGPSEGWSGASRPGIAPKREEVSVRFETNTPETLVHVRDASTLSSFGGVGVTTSPGGSFGLVPFFGAGSSDTFRPLCAPPCEASLALGPQKFALTHADSPLFASNAAIVITKPSVVHAAFVSRHDVRMAGLWTAVGGVALAAIGVPLSYGEGRSCTVDRTTYPDRVVDRCWTSYHADPAIAVPVVGTTMVSLLVALTLALIPDTATFTLSPLAPAAPEPREP